MTWRMLWAAVLIASSSCATTGPRWNGKIWKARHELGAVVRTQANEVIACTDPEFSTGYWLARKDLLSLVDKMVLSCKEWHEEVELVSLEALRRALLGSGGGK